MIVGFPQTLTHYYIITLAIFSMYFYSTYQLFKHKYKQQKT